MLFRLALLLLMFLVSSCGKQEKVTEVRNVGTLLNLKKNSVLANTYRLKYDQRVIKLDSKSEINQLKNFLIKNNSKRFSLWFFDVDEKNWDEVKRFPNIDNIYQ